MGDLLAAASALGYRSPVPRWQLEQHRGLQATQLWAGSQGEGGGCFLQSMREKQCGPPPASGAAVSLWGSLTSDFTFTWPLPGCLSANFPFSEGQHRLQHDLTSYICNNLLQMLLRL